MKARQGKYNNFTLLEILMCMVMMLILTGILLPSLYKAKERAKFTRWFAYNRQWSNDADCVINFNFQEGEGDILKNTAIGCDVDGFDLSEYNGKLMSTTNGTNHNFEWVKGARWGQFKHGLQFNGVDTYVEIPGSVGVNFQPGQDFTIACWARFDQFSLGDGLFSKSGWGSPQDNDAQYDLYCDPTSGGNGGDGSFEVDVFTCCRGWNQSDVEIDKVGWFHIVLRYEGANFTNGMPSRPEIAGQISCFVNGQKLEAPRDTNNAQAIAAQSSARCIIGAIGAKAQHWGASIIFPFQGRIDEFMMLKRGLSDAEIEGMYNMGKE